MPPSDTSTPDRSDTSDTPVSPWTIRDMSPVARNAAMEAAKARGQKISDWLAWSIFVALNAGPLAELTAENRNHAVAAAARNGLDPAEWLGRAIVGQAKAEHEENRQPVVTTPAAPALACSVDDMTKALAAATLLAEKTGKPIPRKVANAFNRQILATLGG